MEIRRGKKSMFLMLIVSVSMFITLSSSTANGMTLAEKGKGFAVIVLPDNPIPSEQKAAGELSDYLYKVTGVNLEVRKESLAPAHSRILIGLSQIAISILGSKQIEALGPEEFIVRVVNDDLLLVGGRPRGSLYAVYSFLEKNVGCRWFNWYGDEYVPERETLAVKDLDRHESPAMSPRDMVVHVPLQWVTKTTRPEDAINLRDFFVRNLMQGPELVHLEVGLSSLGISTFPGGLDMTPYGGISHRYLYPPFFVHSTFWFIPPDKYFREHPEYFSVVQGKRIPDQLCFSNPEVRRLLTGRALQRLEEVGGKGIMSISLQDSGETCACPECKALDEKGGAPGASAVGAIAAVASAVKDKYPDAYIQTLAYMGTSVPPKNIRLPDNLIVIYAPMLGIKTEHLEGWSKIARTLWVWYYPNPYRDIIPTGGLKKMAADFRLFKQVGVKGYFIDQGAPGVFDSQLLIDLQNWLIMKLMWNPEQDIEELVTDFTENYYGAAASYIREYVWGLEKNPDLTGELLVSYQKMFDRAEQAVADKPEFLLRVKQARLGLDRACIVLWNKRVNEVSGVPFTFDDVAARFRKTYTETVNQRMPEDKRKGVLEGVYAPQQMGLSFLDEYRAISLEKKPDIPPQHPDKVAPDLVRQVTTGVVYPFPPTLATEGVVKDHAAVNGLATSLESGSFSMAYWDGSEEHGSQTISRENIKQGKYHLYYLTRVLLSKGKGYVFFKKDGYHWKLQFLDVRNFYDPENPGQWWDIWASVRFEGPAYDKDASPDKPNRFFVDRVVLVKVLTSIPAKVTKYSGKTCYIDAATDGYSFLQVVGTDISSFALTPRAKVSIYDPTNDKWLHGWLGEAGAGETLGSELVTGWTNYSGGLSYEVLTINANGHDIDSAINMALAGAECDASAGTVSIGTLFKDTIGMTLNTGKEPRFAVATVKGGGLTPTYYVHVPSMGNGNYTYYFGSTATAVWLYFESLDASDFAATISLKRVTDCAVTGLHVYTTRSGATRGWARQDSGFDYNSALNLTFSDY